MRKPKVPYPGPNRFAVKGVVSIISRTVWDSLPPRNVETIEGPRPVVWFSDTATPECRNFFECVSIVQELQIQHMDVMRLPDIKHNFLIGGDGRVYEGRGFGVKPSPDVLIRKTYPGSEETLDIAYITSLENTTDQPSTLMQETAKDLVDYAIKSGHVVSKDHAAINYWEKKLKTVANLNNKNFFL